MENHSQTELAWYQEGCPPRKEHTVQLTPSNIIVKEVFKSLTAKLNKPRKKK